MTNWYAVAVGFVVMTVAGLVGLAVPGFGQLTAGLVGGFVAGYMAAGGVGSGAWHGLLAGSLGGILTALIFGLVVSAVGAMGLGPLGPLLGGGLFVALVVLALVMGVESALAGAVGALLAE
ncbi:MULTISPECIES: DUF5518 domain-containing protein [Halorussus]|uniref:DUF5518 domain-containing protein n=1 Tax=Halorussus TaxID=1070314 RepID=UPI000E20CB43|nr:MULTISPECIES: DUF5518 domain-containing protein [Halorussus]NHN57565.1 DUF5518 domain-containing protein [Halorussus sp. JP-T4]